MAIFDHASPKNIEPIFRCPEFLPAKKKKMLDFICSLLKYNYYQSKVTKLATSIFEFSHPKNFDKLLIFVVMCQHAKNRFIPSAHSSDTVNFGVLSIDWEGLLIFDHAHLKNFQSLNLCEIVPACKKSVYSIISFFRCSQF